MPAHSTHSIRWSVGTLLTPAFAVLLAACGSDGGTGTADNPTPGITALSPSEVEQGAVEQVVTIAGSDFVRASLVQLNGGERATTYVSGTELRATFGSADLASAGAAQVVVVNPAPGGGASNVASFTVRASANPKPEVAALSPTAIAAGSAATTVTIQGTGFVRQSRVWVGPMERTGVTYVSPTELHVPFGEAELAAGGSFVLRVTNPGPGGGTSSTVTLEVRTPVPVLTALANAEAAAGLPALTLRITGTGFTSASEVHFNGAPRPTTFVSATTVNVALGEGDLRTAGSFSLTVVNPAPGGGTSNALPLQLVNGVPTISLLPSRGAHAGRSGFSLMVHGSAFVQGSTVHWNGAARPTQYVSGSRVLVEISASDVASPRTAQITVVNPAPGGGTSAAATMTIRAVPAAAVTASRVVPILARDLAADERTGRLYLSTKGSALVDPNSVVAVDPATGSVTARVFVGSEPGRLARSDDGQYLYVGLNGANAVRRVELPSLTPGLQWSVGNGLVAGEIKVLPGQPRSVAVSRQNPGSSPPLAGVTIYDDGVARPQSSPGHTGGNRIEVLDSPTVLYGFNNAHSGFEFFTIGVNVTGARHLNATGGLISGYYTHITGAAGRIYGTDGSVVDAERGVRVGSFATTSDAILVDADVGRAYMLSNGIVVYDLNTFQYLGTVPVSGVGLDHPATIWPRLVRWGQDGIAFLDADELFVVRSPIFAP